MLFTSMTFVLFLLTTIVLFYMCTAQGQRILLLAANYVFYMWMKPVFGLLLFAGTVVTYLIGRAIQSQVWGLRKVWTTVGVVVILGQLLLFKYADFLLSGVGWLLGWAEDPSLGLLLPIGITSYVMAGPEQTIPITYSYIKETCRTQDPKVIAIEVTGMFYSQYGSFSKANITYMPWSLNRVEAALNGAEEELRAGLLFPILDYHSLWTSVGVTGIKQHLAPGTDSYAGYTFLEKIEPQSGITIRGYRADTENYARNLEYLNKIRTYCAKRDIELLLLITPTTGRIAEPALTQLKADIAEMPEVHFVDFNDSMTELGIDDSTDWFDFIHFNCRGAEKFSRYLGAFLRDEMGLPATEGEDESLWQGRADVFSQRRNALDQ